MLDINYVDMPDDFTWLLRVDMTSTSKHHSELQPYILKNPSLRGILNRILNKGVQVDVNSHMNKLGWHGLRDRILAYYINFAQNREHARNINLDTVDEIINLERTLRFSTVSGYSRLVLYGMYLKLSCIEEGSSSIIQHPLYPNKDVVEILKLSKERIINIDYLILQIHHLISFFGKDKVLAYIKSDFSYESLCMKMDDLQKQALCENFLHYSASIGEDEIFISKVV